MLLKNTNIDINEQEPENDIESHFKIVDKYLETYLIPELIAFYIATGYYTSSIHVEGFDIHINTVIKVWFNYNVKNLTNIRKCIVKILKIKYGLIIESEDPLILNKIGIKSNI